MIGFLRAHGIDPGPLQRPILAGLYSGVLACAAAAPVLVGFSSFAVAADAVMHMPRSLAAVVLVAAFGAAGALYGLALGRAANDRRGGWLFGAVFGFILWMAAPIVILPLVSGARMAAGTAALGFLAAFITWGLALGLVFPFVHGPLQRELDGGHGNGQGGGLSRALLWRRREL